MATIRYLSNHSWQAIVRRTGFPKQYKNFKTKTEATQWARSLEVEIDKGRFIDYSHSSKITLKQIIARYESENSDVYRSYQREKSRLNTLEKHLGEYALNQLKPTRIALFRDLRLSQGLSPATVVKDLNTLSKLLKIAQREWGLYLPYNPISMIQKPKVVGHRVRRLSKDEEVILITKSSVAMKNIIIFAIETGMRLGEILNLKWTDIENGMAILRETKNGEVRYVPFSLRAQTLLKTIPEHITDIRIFYHWKSVSGFESSWQKFKKREVLVDLRFHDLRHEAISRMFEKGLNHMEVSAISGHKSLLVLRKYTHYQLQFIKDKLAVK